ncbi:phosphofructokinase [Staphylococcus saprophyticus]|uniref:1-phosphofructokinase family hexose kinase n=1 Tax=Staphylococcus saprophyticus TaxID=29385 RepID=UPI0018894475|nr:PfkB family carbohydrate kinase [Staphylococcus saprophyticus]MBF2782483.1 phosphofructokinase [Staphylococcus saprophyticus]
MIHVVCPNPALDRTLFLSNFKPNTVNRPTFTKDLLGGKGFNVIRPFIHSQFNNYIIHTLLGGFIGFSLEKNVSDNNINCQITSIKDNNRVCTITIDESTHDTYQIYEKGPNIQNKEITKFIENIKEAVKIEDYVIFSGSLPSGMDSNFYMDTISLLQNKNAKCVLDTSGEDLKKGIEGRPWLVKINDEEFLELIGVRYSDSIENVVKYVKSFNKVENIIVTLGENGMIAKFGQKLFKVNQPKINVVNPIASGDIFLGSLIQCISQNSSFIESLKYACSCALTNCLYWYPNLNDEFINKFIKNITLEEI